MVNFWDSNIWSLIILIGVLLIGMLFAHMLKKNIKFLQKTLIPASVLGGVVILIFTTIYKLITKETFFDLDMFSIVTSTTSDKAITGSQILEAVTYHMLGVGFIATALRSGKKNNSKKRTTDIFNSGVTTVTTYLIQAILGIIITIIAVKFIPGLIEAAGIILCFGYGQGTGQALNYGKIYEGYGLVNGANFGLSIAALGFLSASIGGVIYLNYLKRKNKVKILDDDNTDELTLGKIQNKNEISMNGSIDKLTIQIAIIVCIYIVTYLLMKLLGNLVGEGLKATIFGFNFLFGTIVAVLTKLVFSLLKKWGIMKKDYINDFFMNRIAGVAFDIMIVAGIAVIDLGLIKDYWLLLVIMGVVGAVTTFGYIYIVSKKLFPEYQYEQFFAMYGMLTGTASTGMILLREIDPNFETEASNNLAYQSLPAIVFGFPIMLLANWAPTSANATYITLVIVIILFIALNILLFRSIIFKKKKK